MFLIPKITELFMDGVLNDLGWIRYTDKYAIEAGVANADYLEESSVGELKIFEEEGLLKEQRQDKIGALFSSYGFTEGTVNINIGDVPEELRKQYEDIVSSPFQSAIKKASKQLKTSAEKAGVTGNKVIFAVNNGYSSLDAENFERLFVSRCKRDSQSIGHAACVTIDYHQGGFDAFIFCTPSVHKINSDEEWPFEAAFTESVKNHFGRKMEMMLRDQMNPEFLKNRVEPVTSISFEREGIKYEYSSPSVPDSRFEK